MKKKNYNPFKMWGSYLGAIVLYFVLVILVKVMSGLGWSRSQTFVEVIIATLTGIRYDGEFYFLIPILAIFIIIIGFLIGWGIHSLIRKLRK